MILWSCGAHFGTFYLHFYNFYLLFYNFNNFCNLSYALGANFDNLEDQNCKSEDKYCKIQSLAQKVGCLGPFSTTLLFLLLFSV